MRHDVVASPSPASPAPAVARRHGIGAVVRLGIRTRATADRRRRGLPRQSPPAEGAGSSAEHTGAARTALPELRALPRAAARRPAGVNSARRFVVAAFATVCLLGFVKAADIRTADVRAGSIVVRNAWTRPTAAGMPMGVAYFTLINEGTSADAVIAASSPIAGSVEMHESTMTDGMARMRPLKEIAIAPKSTVKVAPNGIHLMLVDLKSPLEAGTTVPLVLQLRKAGNIEILLAVQTRPE